MKCMGVPAIIPYSSLNDPAQKKVDEHAAIILRSFVQMLEPIEKDLDSVIDRNYSGLVVGMDLEALKSRIAALKQSAQEGGK